MKDNKIFDFSRLGFQNIINIMTKKINECVDVSNGLIPRLDDYISKVDWNKIINSDLYEEVLNDLDKTNEQLKTIKNNTIKSVKEYGAIGDGISDDTEAISKAINSGYDILFPTSKGEIYKVTETIHIGVNAQFHNFIGEGIWSLNHANCGIHFISDDMSKPLFNITNAQGIHFYGMNFYCKNLKKGVFLNTSSMVLADKDIVIDKCSIVNFETVVNFWGRGLQLQNNTIAGIGTIVKLNWQNTGSSGQLGDDFGMRNIVIDNNRLHGFETLIQLLSGNAIGLRLTNNFSDNGCKYIVIGKSNASQWDISNNTFLNIKDTYPIFFQNNNIDGFIINNNIFHHDDSFGSARPNNYIFANQITNTIITNNTFHQCGSDVINVATIKNTGINNNNFVNVISSSQTVARGVICSSLIENTTFNSNVMTFNHATSAIIRGNSSVLKNVTIMNNTKNVDGNVVGNVSKYENCTLQWG